MERRCRRPRLGFARPVLVAAALLAAIGGRAWADVRIIDGVPGYLWYHGCGPTAGGMIAGYWDAHGFGGLISGTNDWLTNQVAVKEMVASPGHIRDYAPTPDRTATPADPYHADDCLADFMECSKGRLAHGDSLDTKQGGGLVKYFQFRGYPDATAYWRFVWGLWGDFTASIEAGRPVELFVDRDADGQADHFVAAFGYDDDDPTAPKYLCYNTDDREPHWYGFAPVAPGLGWGVYTGTLFDPGPLAGDADGDGDVDVRDYLTVKAGLGLAAGARWSEGDFDADGDVDEQDLDRLAENFGLDVPGGVFSGAVPLAPEPAGAAILAGGACLLLRRRRRRAARGSEGFVGLARARDEGHQVHHLARRDALDVAEAGQPPSGLDGRAVP